MLQLTVVQQQKNHTMMTILVVDDEPSVLKLLHRIFTRAKINTLTASSVSEAEKILAKEEVDMVLSDVYLHGSTGMELLERLHASRPELPVFLMSGAVTPELSRNAGAAGALDVVSKPFAHGELQMLISKAVRLSERVV